jgi:hypothetical protein
MLYQLSYTRPKSIANCQFSIADSECRQLAIGNRKLAIFQPVQGVGFEPT